MTIAGNETSRGESMDIMHELVSPAFSTALAAGMVAAFAWMGRQLTKLAAKMDALTSCSQASARQQLIDAHDRYLTNGCMDYTERVSFDALYQSYEALGANGIITHYRDEVMALPTCLPGGCEND